MILEMDYWMFYFVLRDDFNISVLQAFVELHEFADLNLVQALRWVVCFPLGVLKIETAS